MLKRLLIPTEDRALTQATILHIHPLLQQAEGVSLLRVVPPDDPDLVRRGERVQAAQADLEQTCELLRARGYHATGDWVEGADPAEAIVEHAGELRASLIVQATHAREDLERWTQGSVTRRVLRRSAVPMLLFNPWNLLSEFGKVLVALDGSESAERVLPLVISFARSFGSEVILLRVAPATQDLGSQGALEETLEGSRRKVEAAGLVAWSLVAPPGDVASTILEVAEKEGAELICMTTHGQALGEGWAFGSTAEAVFRESPLPLLVKRVASLGAPTLGLVDLPQPAPAPPEQARRVLVPLDGSELAAGILRALPALLQAREAELTLLHVVPTGSSEAAEAAETAQLRALARGLSLGKQSFHAKVARGDPAKQILQAARELEVDLVVMSSHGRSGVLRWLRGSVAERVLRRCPVPLVLLNPACQEESNWVQGLPLRRILVPHEGGPFSKAILPQVSELARLQGADVVLLHVAERPPDEPYPERAQARERLVLALEEDRARLEEEGVRASVEVVFGKPAHEILGAAGAADLVALSTHGRSGPARWFFGSVAELVLRHCTRPLLVIRAKATPGGEA